MVHGRAGGEQDVGMYSLNGGQLVGNEPDDWALDKARAGEVV